MCYGTVSLALEIGLADARLTSPIMFTLPGLLLTKSADLPYVSLKVERRLFHLVVCACRASSG